MTRDKDAGIFFVAEVSWWSNARKLSSTASCGACESACVRETVCVDMSPRLPMLRQDLPHLTDPASFQDSHTDKHTSWCLHVHALYAQPHIHERTPTLTPTHPHTHAHARVHQDLDCSVCIHHLKNIGSFSPPKLDSKFSLNEERRWERGVTRITSGTRGSELMCHKGGEDFIY